MEKPIDHEDIVFVFVQPGAMKLVLDVTDACNSGASGDRSSENQFHCTRLYSHRSTPFTLKPGLQSTGAKPRDFARTQAKKCLQSMRVCLQIFQSA